MTTDLSRAQWLTVIGMGDDGVAGVLPAARQALKKASHLFGAARHLARIDPRAAPCAQRHAWPSPLREGITALLTKRHTPGVVAVVSGDPFYYGLGRWLVQHVPMTEMRVMPAVSSIALACARLGWSQQEIAVLSLHGRDETTLHRLLEEGQRLLVLTSDANAPHRIAGMLSAAGFARSQLTLFEALGGHSERCRPFQIDGFLAAAPTDIHPLNMMALELVADDLTRCHGLAAGRPDELFEHDGQITRSDVRAITLAHLQPHPGQCLWDIGAGSGAVAIEWLRSHERMSAFAIERHPQRCQCIRRNAARFGVPHLVLIAHDLQQDVAAALSSCSCPDAVFIGGGASHDVVAYAMRRLKRGGRLVINAVTLETEQLLYRLAVHHGGLLHRIGIERVEPLGRMRGWKPARTIVQWCWQHGKS